MMMMKKLRMMLRKCVYKKQFDENDNLLGEASDSEELNKTNKQQFKENKR